jgi:hypothetical protein
MSTSQKTGQTACDLVTEYEKRQGREVRKAPQGSGFDLISTKGKDVRRIEVKADTGKQLMGKHAYPLTLKEWQIFSTDKNAWLYIVYSINDNPKKLVRLQSHEIGLHQIKIIAPQINMRFREDDKKRLKLKEEDLS